MVDMSNVRITHTPSGTVLAEGPIGWGITPFEGNYYIRKKYLKTDHMRVNFLPGLKDRKFYRIGEVWSTESERELLGRTDVYALVDTMSDENYNMRMGKQTMEAAASAILAALEKH